MLVNMENITKVLSVKYYYQNGSSLVNKIREFRPIFGRKLWKKNQKLRKYYYDKIRALVIVVAQIKQVIS